MSKDFPIVLVKNLPYTTTGDDLYEVFGKYGNIMQVRLGNQADTKGSGLIVFKNLKSAQTCVDKANGYNFNGRYLVVLHYTVDLSKIQDEMLEVRRKEVARIDVEQRSLTDKETQ
ncbi:BA75_01492T0 [Komagataella pastoris]|uniref:BA75_01492T0 n=1 Tax=Komagataella pastoris TaxID=4922 RepID=A0A1B2J5L6_PICPA|nr:BA75_01492T0 [Komagataella pastoris]